MQKFTQEQLMLYLYGEASPILTLAIDKALKDDAELANEIKVLKRMKKQMEDLKKQNNTPSDTTIDAILKYAKTQADKKQE
ncbi:MAG: hypothetical protein KGO81_03345 [Bacteroidota bacterium]|nr:hypothetical protein [Bacteroidota bacterium]